ncbi:hypothetical protein HII26_24460, partial [Paenibacillus aquistagni]
LEMVFIGLDVAATGNTDNQGAKQGETGNAGVQVHEGSSLGLSGFFQRARHPRATGVRCRGERWKCRGI